MPSRVCVSEQVGATLEKLISSQHENLQQRALGVCVIAFLFALAGFAIAYFGYVQVGWFVIVTAAIVNILSMVAFIVFKLLAK